ncbi:hypothetical protein F7725_009725, partial [Dissostichus mawsoni]
MSEKKETFLEMAVTLLQQIKTRVEYKNRQNVLAQRRRERRPCNVAAERARVIARGPNFLLERQRQPWMKSKGNYATCTQRKGWGSERAEPLMEKTYVIQRRYLNSLPAPDIEGIKGEWPFLFSQRGLYSHFGLLTDISILMKLQEALNNKGSHSELNRHPGIEDVLANYVPEVSDKAACILLLLMAYFKEPKNAIMLETDVSDMMNPKAWMLCIDQVVVMGPHDHFVQGIAALFASYYAFNLQYPEHGSSTLEFIQ